jgi:hypothetical protein
MMLATTLPSIRSDQGEHILVFGGFPGSKVNLHTVEEEALQTVRKPAKECTDVIVLVTVS